MSDAVSEIQDVQRRLDYLSGLVRNSQERETVQRHTQLTNSHLRDSIQEAGRFRNSLASTTPRQIAGTFSGLLTRLEERAAEVDRATERLADEYT